MDCPVTEDGVDRIFAKAKASASVLLRGGDSAGARSQNPESRIADFLILDSDSIACGPSRDVPERRYDDVADAVKRRCATACPSCRRRGARRGSRGR